jgi:hypothetical protein
MQYMLLIYSDEKAMMAAPQNLMMETMAAYTAYTQALREAKILVGSDRLKPTAAATTVRAPDGKTKVVDGPFAETREQLGGYYIIDVADLDAALGWAAKCPGAKNGSIEVRPVWPM